MITFVDNRYIPSPYRQDYDYPSYDPERAKANEDKWFSIDEETDDYLVDDYIEQRRLEYQREWGGYVTDREFETDDFFFGHINTII